MAMSYVVGLTGGIGSGKTVASDHFKQLGVPIIDTDLIARLVVKPGQSALKTLANTFGDEILLPDGSLDRDRLREIAFSKAENKALLDSITHPAIRLESLRQINDVTYPYCIVVIPLLTKESEFTSLMQRVLLVTAKHQTKINRVQQRSDLPASEVERIMQTQLSDAQRLSFTDDVIENDGSIEEVHAKVEHFHRFYLKLSQIK